MTPFLQQQSWAMVVFVVTAAAFAVGELSQALKRRRAGSAVDVRGEIVFRLIFFAAILVLPLSRSLVPGAVLPGPAVFVSGAVIAWSGLLLRWWSIRTLGAQFTVVLGASAEQVVVDHGPYRLLRHPSYTGLLAAFLGCGVMWGNWAGTIASCALLLAGLVGRLLREERAMVDALGDAYREFARHRARLVPFLW